MNLGQFKRSGQREDIERQIENNMLSDRLILGDKQERYFLKFVKSVELVSFPEAVRVGRFKMGFL